MPYGTSKHRQRRPLKTKRKPSLPIMTRPVKEAEKPQVTFSSSAMPRRKPLKEVNGKKHSRRRGRREPQHELFLDYKDQVENSRSELLSSSYATLHQTHSDLTTSLAKLKMHNEAFKDGADAQRQALLAPVTAERVETDFTRDGKSVKETIQIGQRIEAFKALLATKEAELALYWAEWERVQAKIVQLGIEVLGPDAFRRGGVAADPREKKKGYGKDVEELDLEHQTWLEEMEEEIRLLGEESITKMQATEKELDATLRKEQASLIAEVFANSD